MRPWTNKLLGFGILGLFLVALGISLCFLWPIFFHYIIQKGLFLSPTSNTFEIWNDTSKLPPLLFKVYLFNWTNPEQLGIKKPHFDQLGPYCFREVRQKDNVIFHHENQTVSYVQRRLWYFDAEHTNGSLNDIVSQLDVVALSAAHKIRYWEYEWQKTLSILLSVRKLYTRRTVNELLFSGYSDDILTMGSSMANDPEIPMFDRFGWFYMRNGSTMFDGHLNMETGENDISRLGILRKWNYKDTTKHNKSPCNIIEGSAGEFWPPKRTKDDITLFSVDMCRPLFYEYEKTTSHFGIEGYRYTIDKKTLGNSTKRRYPHDQAKFFEPTTTTENFFESEQITISSNTESMESIFNNHSSEDTDEYSDNDPDVINIGNCYCNGECTPSGLLNITSCRYGAPVFMSLPHFYKADPAVLDAVEGLRPNANDHSFSITLEPTTGIPLEVSAALQANIYLYSSEVVSLYNNIPNIYMPMIWFTLKAEITDEMASNLRILLAFPTVMLCSGIVMTIIGLCLIAAVALLFLAKKQRMVTAPTDGTIEKMIDNPEKKTEVVYMDKMSSNEDDNVKTDRRLYARNLVNVSSENDGMDT
ncbi:protein croquemort [Polyergus mexicanus]|uniref:protein croquemort n=1 Tax=Polyergus mexicanus TaxID=615972 RepID=UPI0038B67FB9